jgi:hypothetical protein
MHASASTKLATLSMQTAQGNVLRFFGLVTGLLSRKQHTNWAVNWRHVGPPHPTRTAAAVQVVIEPCSSCREAASRLACIVSVGSVHRHRALCPYALWHTELNAVCGSTRKPGAQKLPETGSAHTADATATTCTFETYRRPPVCSPLAATEERPDQAGILTVHPAQRASARLL